MLTNFSFRHYKSQFKRWINIQWWRVTVRLWRWATHQMPSRQVNASVHSNSSDFWVFVNQRDPETVRACVFLTRLKKKKNYFLSIELKKSLWICVAIFALPAAQVVKEETAGQIWGWEEWISLCSASPTQLAPAPWTCPPAWCGVEPTHQPPTGGGFSIHQLHEKSLPASGQLLCLGVGQVISGPDISFPWAIEHSAL